jgi:hypothetical protein
MNFSIPIRYREKMLLELLNFRCWKKERFEFPETGLVLLSGNSGAGKSTILNAIHFALYGVGTKIISHGEKKCSVHLVIQSFDITRTKGPNRLVLMYRDQQYEDQVAQNIIDEHFGTNFTLTSFITQKMVNSFLSLPPTGKMEFLEKLMSSKDDIHTIKDKVKNQIRVYKETLNKIVGKRECIEQEFLLLKEPEIVAFPFRKTYSDKSVKNHTVRWANAKKRGKKLEKQRLLVQEEFSKEQILLSQRTSLMEQKQKIETSLVLLTIERDKYRVIDSELIEFLSCLYKKKELETKLNLITSNLATKTSTKSQLEHEEQTRREESLKTVLQKETDVKTQLASFPSSLEDDVENYQTISEYLSQKTEIQTLEKQLEKETKLFNDLSEQEKSALRDEYQKVQDKLSLFKKDELDTQYKQEEKTRQEITKCLGLISRISKIESELNSIKPISEDDIKTLDDKIIQDKEQVRLISQRKQLFCCPNCSVSLRLDKNKLIQDSLSPLDEHEASQTLAQLTLEISSSQKTLLRLQKEDSHHKLLEKQLKELQADFKPQDEKELLDKEEESKRISNELVGKLKEYSILVSQESLLKKQIDNPMLSAVLKKKQMEIVSLSSLVKTNKMNLDSSFEGVEDSIVEIEKEKQTQLTCTLLGKLISELNILVEQKRACQTRLKEIGIEKAKISTVPSPLVVKLGKEIDALVQEKDTLYSKITSVQLSDKYLAQYMDNTIEQITKEKSDLLIEKEKRESLEKQLIKQQQDSNMVAIALEKILISSRKFSDELIDIEKQIKEQSDIERKCEEDDKNLQLYMIYKQKQEQYAEQKSKVENVKQEEQDSQRRLFLHELFSKKIKDTETVLVCQTCNNINYHMNAYLEKFFPDNPITVEIRPFKETKKKRLRIVLILLWDTRERILISSH